MLAAAACSRRSCCFRNVRSFSSAVIDHSFSFRCRRSTRRSLVLPLPRSPSPGAEGCRRHFCPAMGTEGVESSPVCFRGPRSRRDSSAARYPLSSALSRPASLARRLLIGHDGLLRGSGSLSRFHAEQHPARASTAHVGGGSASTPPLHLRSALGLGKTKIRLGGVLLSGDEGARGARSLVLLPRGDRCYCRATESPATVRGAARGYALDLCLAVPY